MIQTYFEGDSNFADQTFDTQYWLAKAEKRKALINALLWHKDHKVFYNYNFKTQEALVYDSATNYYSLWAQLATKEQA